VLLDLGLQYKSGLDVLPLILREQPFAGVFILTASHSLELAVESMKRGAKGYPTKNLGIEKIEDEVNKCLDSKDLTGEIEGLEESVDNKIIRSMPL
jgi:DNA-binding NtrC family response regulator